MELLSQVMDNLDEVLVSIIKFTQLRNKILQQNICNVGKPDFVPQRLNAVEFADLTAQALAEHMHNGRLVYRDGTTTRFGSGGAFEVDTIIDEEARKLFENDIEQYLCRQKRLLMENSINNTVAVELLRQKQQVPQTSAYTL